MIAASVTRTNLSDIYILTVSNKKNPPFAFLVTEKIFIFFFFHPPRLHITHDCLIWQITSIYFWNKFVWLSVIAVDHECRGESLPANLCLFGVSNNGLTNSYKKLIFLLCQENQILFALSMELCCCSIAQSAKLSRAGYWFKSLRF